MGGAYYGGEGVSEDKAEAVRWCRKAAEQGHDAAKEWLNENGYAGANGRSGSVKTQNVAYSQQPGYSLDGENATDLGDEWGTLAALAALCLGATVCEHGKLLRAASEIGLDFVNEWATDEANGAKANAKRACRLALDELKAGGSWITDPDSKGFYTLVALLHARMSEESHKELFIDFTFRLTDRLDAKSDQYYEYVAGIIEGLGMDGDGVQEALLAEFQAR